MRVPWLVLALLLAASAARADETGVNKAVTYGALGVVVGLFDVGATVYDVAHLATGDLVPKAFGTVETAIAVPQMAVAGYLFMSPPPADGARALTAAWFVWATALAVHGIWTLTSPAEPASRIAFGIQPEQGARTFGVLCSAAGRF